MRTNERDTNRASGVQAELYANNRFRRLPDREYPPLVIVPPVERFPISYGHSDSHDPGLSRRQSLGLIAAGLFSGSICLPKAARSEDPGHNPGEARYDTSVIPYPVTPDHDGVINLILGAELYYRIPQYLLLAMAFVESGRTIGSGRMPWPWTLNIGGKGQFFGGQREALASLESNYSSKALIDVGLMQVNTRWHARKFRNLEAMLDPYNNTVYAAFYLASLAYENGSWTKGVAGYHASKKTARERYLCRVLAEWLRWNQGPVSLLSYCR